eukprot:2837161-Rhodomonas_salina.1
MLAELRDYVSVVGHGYVYSARACPASQDLCLFAEEMRGLYAAGSLLDHELRDLDHEHFVWHHRDLVRPARPFLGGGAKRAALSGARGCAGGAVRCGG